MTTLTKSMMRTILLEEFAALTRHKPAKLDSRFVATLGYDEQPPIPGDTARLELQFGKRIASAQIDPAFVQWEPERFRTVIAKPLARELFDSA